MKIYNDDSLIMKDLTFKPKVYKSTSTVNDQLDELRKLAEQNTKEHRELIAAMKEYLETMQQIIKEIK